MKININVDGQFTETEITINCNQMSEEMEKVIMSLRTLDFKLTGMKNNQTYILGIIASILLGSAVGIFSRNQGAATALAMPLALIAAFVPMVAMFNDKIEKIANVLYTQQINTLINNLSSSNFTLNHFLSIGINMLVFFIIFSYAYVKVDLKE